MSRSGVPRFPRRPLAVVLAALGTAFGTALGGACGGARTSPASEPSSAGSATPRVTADAGDTLALLAPGRIAALPAAERERWTRYLETSRRLRALDRDSMAAELRTAGLARMTRAPYASTPFDLRSYMTEAWFRSDSGRRVAEIVLSFQTPSGGWSKRVDMMLRPRRLGESYYSESDGWSYIATIDNGGTLGQMRFLSRAFDATREERYRAAFLRGLDYLFAAQLPVGCWPQVFPLQGGYHDAATFNDDATVNVLRLMRDVGRDRHPLVPSAARARAADALARGVECIVDAQVVVDGRRTAWGQQHDPVTLEPVGARSYEIVGLSGRESAGIAELLMTLPDPGPRAIEAVHAAVEWFRATAIHGWKYDFETGLAREEGAGPIWARLYEIGTNRPIFANRDGIVLYDWDRLTDRRRGYAWFGTEPAAALERFERWAPRHPRVPTDGAGR